MIVHLILVPYDLGRPGTRSGGGPLRLLEAGLVDALRADGQQVAVSMVKLSDPSGREVGDSFRVNALLAEQVAGAVRAGEFPLVVAGNCNSCLGTLGGVGTFGLGVVWFDAHGDFNTPDTTPSGYFDGFPLNIAVGRSWSTPAATIPGFRPVEESNVTLVGVRDLDSGEAKLLCASQINVCEYDDLQSGGVSSLVPAFDELAARVRSVYVHVDLDVLDPAVAASNEHARPGGLTPDELDEALSLVGERLPVNAAALGSYNPDVDEDGSGLRAAEHVVRRLAAFAGLGARP